MEPTQNKISILIAGATGRLGSLITKRALKEPNLLVNIVVRDPTKDNAKELVAEVEKAGGKVIQADFDKPSSLLGITKGIHTFVCAIKAYDPKAFVAAHMILINDSIKNGLSRFVPSDFVIKLDDFTAEELGYLNCKRAVTDYLLQTPLRVLNIYNGVFMESFFEIQNMIPGYYGDPERKYNFTSYDDTAAFTVAAITEKNRTGQFYVSASNLTHDQAVDIYNKVRGTNVISKRLGSLEDLKKVYDEEKGKKGDNDRTVIHHNILMTLYDDRSFFEKNNNEKFESVEPISFEDYVREHPEDKLQSTS